MWDELVPGRARRGGARSTPGGSTDCFAAVDYFEQRELPFVVAHQLLRRRHADLHEVDEVRGGAGHPAQGAAADDRRPPPGRGSRRP